MWRPLVSLALPDPLAQRLVRAADLLCARPDRGPLRIVLTLVLQHHTPGSVPDLRGGLFEELIALSSQVMDPPVNPVQFGFVGLDGRCRGNACVAPTVGGIPTLSAAVSARAAARSYNASLGTLSAIRSPASRASKTSFNSLRLRSCAVSTRRASPALPGLRPSMRLLRQSRTSADTDVSVSTARTRASRWVSSSTDTVMFFMATVSRFPCATA